MEELYATNKPNIVDVVMIGFWDEETGNAVGELSYKYLQIEKVETEFKNASILEIDAEVYEKLNNL